MNYSDLATPSLNLEAGYVTESQKAASNLIEFDGEKVVTAWAEGKFVVTVWLDVIHG
jgi:hypothetical protein